MSHEVSTSERKGFVYVAWGENFIEEARNSARLVKKHMNLPVALVAPYALTSLHPFDEVIITPFTGTYRDKINMRLSPYDHTIFLDTDTHVLAPMDQLFDMLKRFDVAYQQCGPADHYEIPGMPMLAFEEASAGLLAWRKNDRTIEFFDAWNTEYTAQEDNHGDGAWDQRALRAALWRTDVKLYNLGTDWQLCSFGSGIAMNKIRMVHGRDRDVRAAIKGANIKIGPRMYVPGLGFTPVWHVTPLDYLKLSLKSFWMFGRRLTRLLFHWSGIWRLPVNKRPM